MKNFNSFLPIAEEYVDPFYYPECVCYVCTRDMTIKDVAAKYTDDKGVADRWLYFWENQWGVDPCDFVS